MRSLSRRIWLLAAILLALPAAAQPGGEGIEALVQEGRHQEALERLEEHLKEYPEDSQARFLKGIALAETGRADEAIAVFSRLAEERPELPEPHNNLAVLHAMRGDYRAARAALEAAIEASPENARYHENLGDLHAHLAVEAYGRAAALEESGERAAAKLELMRKLLESPETAAAGSGASGAESDAAAPAPAVASSPCAAAVDAVRAWAQAWASQDAERYLGAYSDAFPPPGGLSRARWEAQRRQRVERPQFIEVTVGEPEVEVCGERRARVTFTQSYRSDTYRDLVRKELWLTLAGEEWRILSERSLEGDGTAVAPSAVAAAGSGDVSAELYRVQLASRREWQEAERTLRELSEAHAALLGGLRSSVERTDLAAQGVWYRIRFGEFRRVSEAQALCRRLGDRGQDCLVVAAAAAGAP